MASDSRFPETYTDEALGNVVSQIIGELLEHKLTGDKSETVMVTMEAEAVLKLFTELQIRRQDND